jgi:preprotein translocase subunit YajC
VLFDWLHIAQEAAAGGAEKQNMLITFFPFILVIGIFWMLVIGPQRRKDNERKAMLGGLSKGDDIVTSGGICGSIIGLNEKTVVVKVSDDPILKLEFLRSSVALVVPEETKES